MSRHRRIKKHSPLTHANTNPLSTIGDISPDLVEIEEGHLDALAQLADQLEQEGRDIKQGIADRTFFPGRAIILN